MRDGVAVSVHPATNLAASPFRFEIGGKDLLVVYELEDAGEAPGAIYHSHTRSEAYPSQTDINFAEGWPGWRWLIVGLADGELQLRCFVIEDGEVGEVEVSGPGNPSCARPAPRRSRSTSASARRAACRWSTRAPPASTSRSPSATSALARSSRSTRRAISCAWPARATRPRPS